ncbi:MAG TPA: cytochrome c [Candidatus Limnocylindrales bacterium]|jgi:mono/diheme cytochrome c family protein|nr:cytochrome c [Candidatus Limnocylindrales bacterium]
MKLSIMIYSLIFLISGASHTAALSAEPDAGKIFYMQHCSSCHGQEGHGNGPVSRYLNVKVPDLTLIKKNNNGIYPLDKVMWAIDGRGDVRAHGDREMPIWGEIFIIEEQRSPQRARESKAKLIAEYIGKLQQ